MAKSAPHSSACIGGLNTAEILAAINRVVPSSITALEIHSSLPALAGTLLSVRKWDFLRAFRAMTRRGTTLIFPAFTFSYTRGTSFDIKLSRSETGLIADWVLELPEAKRTPNPIFSFVVIGPRSEEFMTADHQDAYGDNSVFSVLDRLDSGILMLGAKWDYCSFLHHLEQEQCVPYREFKTFHEPADFGAGRVDPALRVFVRRGDIQTELDFAAAGRLVEDAGEVSQTSLGLSSAKFVPTNRLAALCRRELRNNPFFLVREGPRVESDIHNIRMRSLQRPYRVAILGSENIEPVADDLRRKLAVMWPSRSFDVFSNPYGQMLHELSVSTSDLAAFDPDITIFIDTLGSLCGVADVALLDEADSLARASRWYSCVQQWIGGAKGKAIVLLPHTSHNSIKGGDTETTRSNMSASVTAWKDELARHVQSHGGTIVNTVNLAAEHPAPMFDARIWYLARIPFSASFISRLTDHLAGLLLEEVGGSARLVVIDLDNTIWGGVAADDGVEGLALGGDYPGTAYRDFQLELKRLAARGVALAVVSKNDAEIALDVIDKHPQMVLRRADFADLEINWGPKSDSLVKLSRRLNVGLSNIVFLDDSPVERAAVRRLLPDVVVPDLGDDPARFVETLRNLPQLNTNAPTSNEITRVSGFRAMSSAAELRAQVSTHDEFVRELGVEITIRPLEPRLLTRAERLMAKTNQFNTSVRRYTGSELAAIEQSGGCVLLIDVQDKYSERECMGVAVFRPDKSYLDSLVLSCRTLGKGVEAAVLNAFAETSMSKHARPLFVAFVDTPRNDVAKRALALTGFSEMADGWVAGERTLLANRGLVRVIDCQGAVR